jgi:glycosyltransferase involved in cell wall biosynthesis
VVARHHEWTSGTFELWLVADSKTVHALDRSGHALPEDRVVRLEDASGPLRSTAFPRLALARRIANLQARTGFDLVYVPLPSPRYLPALWVLASLPASRRPRLAIGVVDCTLANSYRRGRWRFGSEQWKIDWVYRAFFRGLPLDGVLTWYRAVREAFDGGAIPSRPLVHASPFCFVDVDRFRPALVKQRRIVYAARFSEQKRPVLFLEAVARLVELCPERLSDWQIEMYGSGPLEGLVRAARDRLGLTERVVLGRTSDLAPVLAASRVFVSTQAHENFSSLAVLEAMASGNVVVAFGVGETWRFVRDRENGILVLEENAIALADGLAAVLDRPIAAVDELGSCSRAMATCDFAPERFLIDFESFCRGVLAAAPRGWMSLVTGSRACRDPRNR